MPVHNTQAYDCGEEWLYSFLPSALDGSEWSYLLRSQLTPGNGPFIPAEQEAVWHQIRSSLFQEERNLFPLLQIEPRFSSLPARRPIDTSTGLYRIVIYLQPFILSRRKTI
jgi:hypothetical protein